jgi:hypothetical protein
MDKKLKLKTELLKKLKQETTGTGTGASVTPGIGAGVAAKYAFGKTNNSKPTGWKNAPSIANRPSDAIKYKELWEGELKIDDIRSFNYNISKVREAIRQMRDENSEELYKDLESLRFGTDLMSVINILDKLKLKIDKNPKLDKITMADALKAIEDIRMEYKPEEQDDDEDKFDWYTNKNLEELQEGYAQFRNETKTRSKPDQFHQAVKQVKKKMNEINRIFEYVDRLKGELSEGEDLKYKKYTENAFAQIKESAKQLFLKSTKLK